MAAPRQIDECGEIVPADLVEEAKRRHVRLVFGPKQLEWKVTAGRKGASIGIKQPRGQRVDAEGVKEMFPAMGPIPGGEGTSDDAQREDVRRFLQQLDVHNDHQEEKPTLVPYSDIGVMAAILANSILMMMEHFDGRVDMGCTNPAYCTDTGLVIMPAGWFYALVTGEIVFNVVFTVEAICKILANGSFLRYIVRPINQFDFLLVVLSDVMMLLNFFSVALPNVSFFRLARLLRAFRMLNHFHHLRLLFSRVYHSVRGFYSVLFAGAFLAVLASLLGMNIFMCSVRPPDCPEESKDADGLCPAYEPACHDHPDCPLYKTCSFSSEINFNTLFRSCISMIILLTGEDWGEILFASMRSNDTGELGMYIGVVFVTFFFLVLHFVIRNLFIAVILTNFEPSEVDKEALQEVSFRMRLSNLLKNKLSDLGSIPLDEPDMTGENADLLALITEEPPQPESDEDLDQKDKTIFCLFPPATPNPSNPNARKNLRGGAKDVLRNPWTQRIVLTAIVASCVVLALDSPIEEYRHISAALVNTLNLVTFAIFALEFLLKLLDHGVWGEHPQAYFRNSWNALDFVILVAQAADIAGLDGISVLRVVRVLRPLRLLSHIKKLQLLIAVMAKSLYDFGVLAIVAGFILTIASILGVNLFAGSLHHCSDQAHGLRALASAIDCDPTDPSLPARGLACDPATRKLLSPSIDYREQCSGSFLSAQGLLAPWQPGHDGSYVAPGDKTEILLPRAWTKERHNFDNVLNSLHSVVSIWSLDDWPRMASKVVGHVGEGKQPQFGNYPTVHLYFWAVILLMNFFISSLIVAVLLDNLAQASGVAVFTELQKNWRRFQAKIQRLKPLVARQFPDSPLRRKALILTDSPAFDNFFLTVILLNTVFMATDHYHMSDDFMNASKWINIVFTVFYVIEIAARIFAHSWQFFASAWSNFDFLVTAVSLVEVSLAGAGSVQALRVLRLLRAFRTIRVIRKFPALFLMIQALKQSFTSVLAAVKLVTIYIFIFAVIGSQLFAGVKHGRAITNLTNMHDVGMSMFLLFQVGFNQNMQDIIWDASVEFPACTICTDCYVNPSGELQDYDDCGSSVVAILFFDLFYVGIFILLQLVLSVLLLNYFAFEAEVKFVLNDGYLETFRECWKEIDPAGTGQASIWHFRDLVERLHILGNPMGSCALVDPFNHRAIRIEILQGQRDCTHMEFQTVAQTLALNVAGVKALPYEEMVRRKERLCFFAQAAFMSQTVLRFGKKKHARDVLLSKIVRSNLKPVSSHVGTDPRVAFSFVLTDRQGYVFIDVDTKVVYLFSNEARVEMKIPLWDIADLVEDDEDPESVKLVFGDGRECTLNFLEESECSQFVVVFRGLLESDFDHEQSQGMARAESVVDPISKDYLLLFVQQLATQAMADSVRTLDASIHNRKHD